MRFLLRVTRVPHVKGVIILASVVSVAFGLGLLMNTTPTAEAEPPSERGPQWYRALVADDAAAPRADLVLSGIRVGPGVIHSVSGCDGSAPTVVPLEAIASTALDIAPGYLPPGTEAVGDPPFAVRCGNSTLTAEAYFWVPPDRSNGRFGGAMDIFRFRGDQAFGLPQPTSRISARSVANKPAVVVRPLTADGFGDTAILIAEPWGLTVVRADGLPLSEVLRIAESIYEGGDQ